MNCRKLCTAATLFVLFPALELSSAGPDQGQEYYMPGWVWWVIILIALVSIFWWYLYLRPGQAAEILELEQQVGGGHGHKIIQWTIMDILPTKEIHTPL
jgi:hypothetical protein